MGTKVVAPLRDLNLTAERLVLDYSSTTLAVPGGGDYLLKEDGDYLLQEIGDKILLDWWQTVRPALVTAPIRDLQLVTEDVTGMSDELFIIEGPRQAREGEELTYSVTWTKATTLSSAATRLYLNGTLSTSPLSGSETTSGNVQTLRTFTVPTGWGGKTCVLEAWCAVDSNTLSVGIPIKVLKAGAER